MDVDRWIDAAKSRGWTYEPPSLFGDAVHRFVRGDQRIEFTRHAAQAAAWSGDEMWKNALDQRDAEAARV
jgi:hypothetical protein